MSETTVNKKISVMIVDDSSTYRNILRSVLTEDPEIEVVAQAVNGKLALPRIRYYKPEVLLLDNEMPEMTGLETLEAMNKEYPEIGVIMFSSHTIEGARVTIRALELGALDFVTKPGANDGSPAQYIREKLIKLLKSIVYERRADKAGTRHATEAAIVRAPEKKVREIRGSIEATAIGISTGGPAALRELVGHMKGPLSGPVFIVQHMPPLFTRQLAESLDRISQYTIVEGEDGMIPEKGKVYIAPGGRHMIVEKSDDKKIIRILDTPPENNCRPSVNVLFRSIAEAYGSHCVAVIMTGMGNDGYEGLKDLKQKGAFIIGQSEKSCLVYGMPSAPTRDGIINESLDIQGIGERILNLMGS